MSLHFCWPSSFWPWRVPRTPGALIGTADALALGTPTNPSPVAAGALLCTSSLAEVELITNDYGVIEPLAAPEPAGVPLAGAALRRS